MDVLEYGRITAIPIILIRNSFLKSPLRSLAALSIADKLPAKGFPAVGEDWVFPLSISACTSVPISGLTLGSPKARGPASGGCPLGQGKAESRAVRGVDYVKACRIHHDVERGEGTRPETGARTHEGVRRGLTDGLLKRAG